jgi:hypothetical protein
VVVTANEMGRPSSGTGDAVERHRHRQATRTLEQNRPDSTSHCKKAVKQSEEHRTYASGKSYCKTGEKYKMETYLFSGLTGLFS